MKWKSYYILFLSIFVFAHCKKEEGFGGLASIQGKVYAVDYNKDGEYVDEGYLGDFVVYLGTISTKDDDSLETIHVIERVRTSYDGSFLFEGLRKGTYDVWVYSQCSKCAGDITPIIQRVEIKGKKSKIELEDFKIDI